MLLWKINLDVNCGSNSHPNPRISRITVNFWYCSFGCFRNRRRIASPGCNDVVALVQVGMDDVSHIQSEVRVLLRDIVVVDRCLAANVLVEDGELLLL